MKQFRAYTAKLLPYEKNDMACSRKLIALDATFSLIIILGGSLTPFLTIPGEAVVWKMGKLVLYFSFIYRVLRGQRNGSPRSYSRFS
jgi:hypothetical protein